MGLAERGLRSPVKATEESPRLPATVRPRSARPGSHNKCKYRSSLSSRCPTRPNTTLPSPVPLIPNPTAAAEAPPGSALSGLTLPTSSSRVTSSGPGSTMYSPSELERSLSEAVATIGLHPSILYRDMWMPCLCCGPHYCCQSDAERKPDNFEYGFRTVSDAIARHVNSEPPAGFPSSIR
ncbi:hypothetical protein EYF80_031196 [Liparis tanakae]|uniref:Uncharacterized protein n=1 Tax=Liparis tanakae TaxID=230148 RepID=A0A4Z2GYH4_9TELE|nr:hypothetical protein EYF80_031196 [Liparis tanakae]